MNKTSENSGNEATHNRGRKVCKGTEILALNLEKK